MVMTAHSQEHKRRQNDQQIRIQNIKREEPIHFALSYFSVVWEMPLFCFIADTSTKSTLS